MGWAEVGNENAGRFGTRMRLGGNGARFGTSSMAVQSPGKMVGSSGHLCNVRISEQPFTTGPPGAGCSVSVGFMQGGGGRGGGADPPLQTEGWGPRHPPPRETNFFSDAVRRGRGIFGVCLGRFSQKKSSKMRFCAFCKT